MELVVDANILFAALIKNSHTRHLLINNKQILYIPEFIFDEISKHLKEIERKTGLAEKEIKQLLDTLIFIGNIQIVSAIEFKHKLLKAYDITPDQDDALYFALALKLNCAIWSNDKQLKNQKFIKVYCTEEL